MSGKVRTNDVIATPPDVASVSATLFEQLGNTAAISKPSVFQISLPVGGADPPADPLPDYE